MIIVVIGPIPERLETDRDGTKHNTEQVSASPTMDAQRLECIEQRITDEVQYTGQLKLSLDNIAYQLNRLEERVTAQRDSIGAIDNRLLHLEGRVLPPLEHYGAAPTDHESRLRRLEGKA